MRGGRVVARVLLVWVLAVGALQLLDAWLAGFSMPEWWQPTVCALLFGVLSAVLWPLVLRVALPVAVFTLGIGSFLLLGAGVLAISFAVPGVVITDFGTAVVVAVAVAGLGSVVSSVVGLDEDELFFRRAARRGALAGTSGDESMPPGVLLLQIDGLGIDTLRRAVRTGDMPAVAWLLDDGSHLLAGWHTDWSSQTGASVSGILHGTNDDIIGFRWYEKDRDRVMACSSPEDAAEIERRHSDGRGLLAVDGAARASLFTGDAAHTSLTMSALPLISGAGRRRRGRDGAGAGYYAYFANPANALRTVAGALVDIGREISAAVRQRRAGVRPRVNRGGFYPLARAGTTVIARDVVVVGDHRGHARRPGRGVRRLHGLRRGRRTTPVSSASTRWPCCGGSTGRSGGCTAPPSSRRGPTTSSRSPITARPRAGPSPTASASRSRRWSGGCAASRSPTRAAGRTRRRATPAESWQIDAVLAEASSGGGPIARRLRARVERSGAADRPRTPSGEPGEGARVAPGIVVVASGHLATVSFTEREGRVELETIEREYPELLPSLVDHPGVGFVLVRSAEFGPVVLGRDGLRRLATDVVIGDDPLEPYGPHAADLVRRVDGFPHCADVMINSRYDPARDEASPFEPHVGSHGGLGGGQTRGFLLHPADLPPPGEIVGAEALHGVLRGWLTHLGHPEPADAGQPTVPAAAE